MVASMNAESKLPAMHGEAADHVAAYGVGLKPAAGDEHDCEQAHARVSPGARRADKSVDLRHRRMATSLSPPPLASRRANEQARTLYEWVATIRRRSSGPCRDPRSAQARSVAIRAVPA